MDSEKSESEGEGDLAEDSEREEADTQESSSPTTKYECTPLNCFKDLFKSSGIYSLMQDFAGNIAPLSVIGMFLNYAGNHILHYIHTVMKRKIFFPSHRVTGI